MDQNQQGQKQMLDDGQLAKAIYLRNMAGMKEILNLAELRIGDRESKAYKFFKKVVMDQYYNSMTDLFSRLEERGVVMKCSCGTSIRQGYKPCPQCNGAGHCNTPEFQDWMDDCESEYPEEHGQPFPEDDEQPPLPLPGDESMGS